MLLQTITNNYNINYIELFSILHICLSTVHKNTENFSLVKISLPPQISIDQVDAEVHSAINSSRM